MDVLSSIFLGAIEGITEFLPVSSTAHLLLLGQAVGIPQTEFTKTFDIVIQFGAILAVVYLYGKSLLTSILSLKRVAAAFIPTAIIGLILHPVVKNIFFESNELILASLFIGGIVLVLFDTLFPEKENAITELEKLPYSKAVLIGLFQSIAIVPGVSRSAATILGGILIGISRQTIVKFSFLLAVPTMLAATVLDLAKSAPAFSGGDIITLCIGLIISFITALFSIKWLLSYVQHHSFAVFGVYRMCAAVILWLLLSY